MPHGLTKPSLCTGKAPATHLEIQSLLLDCWVMQEMLSAVSSTLYLLKRQVCALEKPQQHTWRFSHSLLDCWVMQEMLSALSSTLYLLEYGNMLALAALSPLSSLALKS